jgi:hypothetical protein
MKVALSPEAVSNPIIYIKKQINGLLHKYHEELNGILLSYSNLKFESGKEYARIIGEQPWLHVNVQTKCIVFRTEKGYLVNGRVLKVIYFEIQYYDQL